MGMTRTLAAKICASIAADSPVLMKESAQEAFSRGADFVEFRFDYLKPDQLPIAMSAVNDIKGKAIFTLRSDSQGGKFAGSEPERISWLRKMGEQRPMLLDVELDTLRNNDDLADFLESRKTPILVSWHDFHKTPSVEELADILSEMRVYSNFVKIVTTAQNVGDAIRLLDMYENAIGLNAVIFAMGEPGVISRVLSVLAGNAPFTYASLDSPVAPGQISVMELRKIYDRVLNRFSAGS